jgi:hypothetical protein
MNKKHESLALLRKGAIMSMSVEPFERAVRESQMPVGALVETPKVNAVTARVDGEFDLRGMLSHISKTAKSGHSFTIIVDPEDVTNKKVFGVDGDGQDRVEVIERLKERAGEDGWVDLLEAAPLDEKILLPPVKPGHVRLYRGTPVKHKVQSLAKADPYALFGPGIYLTSSKRIAGDYTTKGAHSDQGVIFRYQGRRGVVSKQEVIDTFIRQTARYMDDEGRPSWEQPMGHLGREYEKFHFSDDPGTRQRKTQAAALWKKMEKDHEVRIGADGVAVIRKKQNPADVAVYDVPQAWIAATIDAEAETDERVALAMHDALKAYYVNPRDAGEVYDFAMGKDNDTGDRPAFRQVYARWRHELGDKHAIFRRELKDRGVKVKGVRYQGGVTMGGGGRHEAFAFWDEQGLAKLRVNESMDEAKAPPGAKRAKKLVAITQKAREKETAAGERHRATLAKIRQATADAQRKALMTTEAHERMLAEAAMKVSDLPANVGVQVKRERGTAMRVTYWNLSADRRAFKKQRDPVEGYILMDQKALGGKPIGKCGEAFMIQWAGATKGWGPLLYDVALEVATKLGGGLMADRHSVSPDAHGVWSYYVTRRPDVKVHQLDDMDPPHLTPTKKDDCAQVSAKSWGQNMVPPTEWPGTPESKRITKSSMTTLLALVDAGRLKLDHITAAELGLSLAAV